MFPENNKKLYDKLNNSALAAGNCEYLYYVEARLNNRLMLLNNPVLAEQLGLDMQDLLIETQKLIAISNYIEIPNVVEENEKRKRGLFG